jgi:hypothetical protein
VTRFTSAYRVSSQHAQLPSSHGDRPWNRPSLTPGAIDPSSQASS